MPTENQYPPQHPRPADFEHEGRIFRHDYDCSFGRSLWTVWTHPKTMTTPSGPQHIPPMFTAYAVRWPSGNVTVLPKLPDDPEVWLSENTKEPTA